MAAEAGNEQGLEQANPLQAQIDALPDGPMKLILLGLLTQNTAQAAEIKRLTETNVRLDDDVNEAHDRVDTLVDEVATLTARLDASPAQPGVAGIRGETAAAAIEVSTPEPALDWRHDKRTPEQAAAMTKKLTEKFQVKAGRFSCQDKFNDLKDPESKRSILVQARFKAMTEEKTPEGLNLPEVMQAIVQDSKQVHAKVVAAFEAGNCTILTSEYLEKWKELITRLEELCVSDWNPAVVDFMEKFVEDPSSVTIQDLVKSYAGKPNKIELDKISAGLWPVYTNDNADILLGAQAGWLKRKGLSDLIRLFQYTYRITPYLLSKDSGIKSKLEESKIEDWLKLISKVAKAYGQKIAAFNLDKGGEAKAIPFGVSFRKLLQRRHVYKWDPCAAESLGLNREELLATHPELKEALLYYPNAFIIESPEMYRVVFASEKTE